MTDRHREVARYEPVMGTVVEIRTEAADPEAARAAETAAIDEMDRLERVLSAYDPSSDLCRWRAGEVFDPAPELLGLVDRADGWRRASAGAFHPAVGALTGRWRQAERDGEVPSADELAALVRALESSGPRTPDYNLDAMAKGFVVDAGLAAAAVVPGVLSVVVNAGGDLVHTGDGSTIVGIENPARPYDNEPPLVRIELARRAVATSGRARRGFRVSGRWFSHVIDPRTGWPADARASVSVMAPTAEIADVVATVVGVLGPGDGLAVAQACGYPELPCFVIDLDGRTWSNAAWRSVIVS